MENIGAILFIAVMWSDTVLNSRILINELLLLVFSLEVCTEKSVIFKALGAKLTRNERD